MSDISEKTKREFDKAKESVDVFVERTIEETHKSLDKTSDKVEKITDDALKKLGLQKADKKFQQVLIGGVLVVVVEAVVFGLYKLFF